MNNKNIGVLLLNLGGPERLKDVRPFLYNLFADPEIIRLPFPLLQAPLAWFISTFRSKKSQANYKKIGGGSPLRQITEAQAQELREQLQREEDFDCRVYIGMRYWHPFTEEAIAQIKQDRIEQLVILPLYPQFSISTTGSSFRLLEKIWAADPALQKIEYTIIPSWYKSSGYLNAMASLINQTLEQVSQPESAHVFFSAHGVPVSYVQEAGDPYQREIEDCVSLIMEHVDHTSSYTLAYQSRVGPEEWLKPYTDEAIQELACRGVEELVVVPISFVSEHIETLEEIDIEYRDIAEEAGIRTFARVPALNTHPTFIEGLSHLVIRALSDPPLLFSDTLGARDNIKIYPRDQWEWGMTLSAEMWNGRLAMIGLVVILLELFLGIGPLHSMGML